MVTKGPDELYFVYYPKTYPSQQHRCLSGTKLQSESSGVRHLFATLAGQLATRVLPLTQSLTSTSPTA